MFLSLADDRLYEELWAVGWLLLAGRSSKTAGIRRLNTG